MPALWVVAGGDYRKWVVHFVEADEKSMVHLDKVADWGVELRRSSIDQAIANWGLLSTSRWIANESGGLFARPIVQKQRAIKLLVRLKEHIFLPLDDKTEAPLNWLHLVLFFDGVTVAARGSTRALWRMVGETHQGERFMTSVRGIFDIWGGEGDVWKALLDKGDDEDRQKEVHTFLKLVTGKETLPQQSKPYSVLQMYQMTTTFLKTFKGIHKVNLPEGMP